MTKDNKKLIEVLKKAIDESEEIWKNETQSHAYIIGWLQGTIRTAIWELEATDKHYKYELKD